MRTGGPVNIAGLSGDDGFWVAIEDHQLVALLVKQPKPQSCTLRWRGSKNTFTCDDKPVASRNMARFRSFTGRTAEPPRARSWWRCATSSRRPTVRRSTGG